MQTDWISKFGFEQCQKCSICTTVCPMLAVNPSYPGPKQAGPDGERLRLKDPDFYDAALKYCLNCKRCENACPSGVQIADLICSAKAKYGKSKHPLRDWALSSTDLVGTMASAFAPIANPILSTKLAKNAMDGLLGVDRHRQFPAYSGEKFTAWFGKQDQSRYEKKVSFFHGCYVQYNYPQLGKDFVKVLNAAGYGVELLEKEKCCGVALISNGLLKQAARNAATNIASIQQPTLTVSTSCTYTMREEYDHLLGLDNTPIRDNLTLAMKWLCEKVESGEVKFNFRTDLSGTYAYHTSCHMNRLGWSYYTLKLLRQIPGITIVELPQECCGISGTFGFKKENYEFSQKIGSKLFDAIRESGAQAVVTECETCKWQIEMSTDSKVLNPISLLASALQ